MDALEYLLSEELQSMITWAFPAREEYFEAYLQGAYADPNYYYDQTTGAIIDFNEGYHSAWPDEETFSTVRKMVERAVYGSWGGRNNPI